MRIQLSDAIYSELEASMLGSFRHDRMRLELGLLIGAWKTTRNGAEARILD